MDLRANATLPPRYMPTSKYAEGGGGEGGVELFTL